MSVFRVLFTLLLAGLQIYVSLRLIGRRPTWRNVIPFALFHASSVALFANIVPGVTFQFLASSIAYFAYFTLVFRAPLFPDALVCYLSIQALRALGDVTFQLFIGFLPMDVQPSRFIASIGPHWPFPILLIYFLQQDVYRTDSQHLQPSSAFNSLYWLMALGVLAIGFFLVNPVINSPFCNVFIASCLIAMPLICYAVQRKDEQTDKSLQYHARQSAIQKTAIKTLREERHEFVNDLTLISTYLQMGKISEALTCLNYSTAKLADRNNYAVLPHDAWLTILNLKEQEAKRRGLDFQVKIQAAAPTCFKEQRLLPRLIINLVDNAFEAVAKEPNPQVFLSWSLAPTGERLLEIKNNGPEIPPWNREMIFRGGVTTKKRSKGNHGWGLVICKEIAEDLNGSLSYKSSPGETTFSLTLPPADLSCEELKASS